MDVQDDQAGRGQETAGADDGSSTTPVTAFSVIALAASAGGLRTLSRLLAPLPPDLPAAIIVLQHLDPNDTGQMAPILARRSGLPVVQALDGQPLEPGVVAVAPPAHHLEVAADDTLRLSDDERVPLVHPSADVLFASLAEHVGPRAVVTVLTGTGTDGSSTLCRVRDRGGTVIVEDPATAEFPGMPRAAVSTGCVDHVREIDDVPLLLEQLVR